jgi:heme/copper-type cytochrome/quinol oxidase subunit 1
MSATTAAPAVDDVAPDVADVAYGSGPGLAGLLGTADHLVVGRLFLVSSLLLLVVGRVAGVLVDAERLDTSSISILDEYAGQVFSLHLVVDLFLFLVPAFLGLAIAMVPLQVGAATVAFPRAAAGAFWMWLLSSGVLLASYIIEGGPQGFGTKADGIVLWTVAFGGVVAGILLATVCVLTTAIAMRAPGMTLDRVPAFTWSMLVAGVVWLVSLPVLVGVLVVAYLDVHYGAGIDASSSLAWAFSSPQVFVYALPALGLLLDVAPVSAGVRQRGRGAVLVALAAAALLSFGAYLAGAAFDPGIVHDPLAVGTAFALLLPLLALAGAVATTLRAGRLSLDSPLLFGTFAFLLLLAAVAVAAARSVEALELVGTSADAAIRELVVVAGLLGVAGGAHYWSTKLRGATLREPLARLAAVVLFLGGLLAAGPDIVSGILDQLDGVASVPTVRDGVEALNAAALAGGLVVLLGVLLVGASLFAGESGSDDEDDELPAVVPADPWDGHTLEWATASPPVPGVAPDVDVVASAAPLLDRKEAGVQEVSA